MKGFNTGDGYMGLETVQEMPTMSIRAELNILILC